MPKGKSATSTLRTLNQLIKDVEIIHGECGGTSSKGSKGKEKKLDAFQQSKKDLSDLLKTIKTDIRTQRGIEERQGSSTEAIKLKQRIDANLKEAKTLHSTMEQAYKQDEHRSNQGKKDSVSLDELKSREELVTLMKQDLDFTSNEFKPKQQVSRGFQVAAQAREKRRQKREQGLMSNEPQPLTAKQQHFIQESIQRDAILDEKLDVIKQGVMQLGQIAADVNVELDKQAVMLEEVDEKMDKVTEKLEKRNKQMKDILEQTGGAQRWCPVIVLFVILLALAGYIYNILTG